MNRRSFIWLGLAALAFASVAYLSPAPAPAADDADSVTLGYFANVTHAQAVLGVASGDFQKALGGVQLKTKVFNAGPELIQALNAGAIDIGYVGPGPTIAAFAQSHGESIRVISGVAANGVVIVAGKDSGINSMKDLAGKRIATPQLGNTQDVSARHYVMSVLGQADANNVLPVPNSQQAGMMARGDIDAAWVPEPWGARLIAEAGAKLIGEEKDLWPDHEFSLTVIVTTPEFLAQHRDIVEKLLAAHRLETTKLQTDPGSQEKSLGDALKQLTGKRLPASVLHDSLARTKFTNDALPETFKTMAHWSAQEKFIKHVPDLTKLFDTSIMSAGSSAGGSASTGQGTP